MAAPTAKATEVKKPKTFWMRTKLECIVAVIIGDGEVAVGGYRFRTLGDALAGCWGEDEVRWSVWLGAWRCSGRKLLEHVKVAARGDDDHDSPTNRELLSNKSSDCSQIPQPRNDIVSNLNPPTTGSALPSSKLTTQIPRLPPPHPHLPQSSNRPHPRPPRSPPFSNLVHTPA